MYYLLVMVKVTKKVQIWKLIDKCVNNSESISSAILYYHFYILNSDVQKNLNKNVLSWNTKTSLKKATTLKAKLTMQILNPTDKWLIVNTSGSISSMTLLMSFGFISSFTALKYKPLEEICPIFSLNSSKNGLNLRNTFAKKKVLTDSLRKESEVKPLR